MIARNFVYVELIWRSLKHSLINIIEQYNIN